jgi:hypothetical protein
VHFLPSFSFQRIKSLSGALDSFVVDAWPFFSRGKIFSPAVPAAAEKKFSRGNHLLLSRFLTPSSVFVA